MRTVAVWTAFVLAYSSSPLVAGIRYTDPIAEQSGNTGDIVEKRVNLNEPTCEELRAIWRYTKRQSRAAKTSTGYPIYTDPFSYNVWMPHAERSKPVLKNRSKYPGRARNRAGAPIYGRMVHKVPAESVLRNGMRQLPRLFDKTRFYGTIKSYQPSPKRPLSNVRTIGGGSSPSFQTGSFDQLKELLRAVRARELKEQHRAEELAERLYTFKEPMNNDFTLNVPRKQFSKPNLRIPAKIDYDFDQERYSANMPNIGQAWTNAFAVHTVRGNQVKICDREIGSPEFKTARVLDLIDKCELQTVKKKHRQ